VNTLLQHCSARQIPKVIALAIFLSGCGSDDSTGLEVQPDQLSVGMPDRIRQVQALDLDTVEAIATVNGQEFQLERTGEQYRTSITVASNSSVALSIRFRERLEDGGVLDLADFSSTLNVGNENETLQLFNNDFNDSPFDLDNDELSNLVEREEGTDPFVFDTRPENRNFTINFALPRIINEPEITQVIATIAGTPRAVNREGNNFEIVGLATTRTSVAIEVILLQRLPNSATLVLANATRSISSGIQDETVNFVDNDFDFDRDQDGDGRTNLQELQDGTDPFTQN